MEMIDVGQIDYKDKKVAIIYNPAAGKKVDNRLIISKILTENKI